MKRVVDVVGASLGLLLLSPLFALIAAAIKLTSPGGVFFRQERVGRNFDIFTLYKFRSMIVASDGPLITAEKDERITSVGRVLRRFKLDEIPQLINVLLGDMSFVGPRPEVLPYVEMFRDEYAEVLRVRPGITDPASIEYRNESALLASASDPEFLYISQILPRKIELSREYAANASLASDVRLIAKSLLRLVGGLR